MSSTTTTTEQPVSQFEEYKLFIQYTQQLSERRQAATQTFLTINTAIFSVLAFLVKDGGFAVRQLALFSAPLFLVGLVICVIWRKILLQYKELGNWRFEQLRIMEQAMPDSSQVFTKEWDQYYKPRQGKERFGFSRLETWLPQLCIVLYVVYGVGVLVFAL